MKRKIKATQKEMAKRAKYVEEVKLSMELPLAVERSHSCSLEWDTFLTQANGDADTERRLAQMPSGNASVIQAALRNATRRSRISNPCWFFKQGNCVRGSVCPYSHDVIPFAYCVSYNNTGYCCISNCPFKHELVMYNPPQAAESRELLLAWDDPPTGR